MMLVKLFPMRVILPLVLAVGCLTPAAGDTAFWVWNRSAPLSDTEKNNLQAAGVTTLYWHFAEIENRSGMWAWKKRLQQLPEKSSATLRIVPVIRLEAAVAKPFLTEAREALKQKLADAFRVLEADEWQVDYDAPDRLVNNYAEFLAELRPLAPRLSSTALAGWVRLPAFHKLCDSVAELCPMFYDLNPDEADRPLPLIDVEGTSSLMNDWKTNCPAPWRVGLPWFARLTVYGHDGISRGHFRQWAWDDVVFRRELKLAAPSRNGVLVLCADKEFVLSGSTVRSGDRIVARWPNLSALPAQEKNAGREAVFFRLPNAAASSGWSLRQFATRRSVEKFDLVLRQVGECLVLSNEGEFDLPPRVVGDGPLDRGYAIELDAAGPVFREAEAGEFFRLAGHREPDSENPKRVPFSTATRLTLWFSALPAGASRKSGIFQLAPAAKVPTIRYRILNLEENPPWKLLKPVP